MIRGKGWFIGCVGASLLAASQMAGCLSMQSQSTLDAINGSQAQPFVEAYVEYPGPQRKWAGPASFVLHIVAKDAGNAQISVAPNLFDAQDGDTAGRLPAAVHGIPGETARSHIAELAVALQGQQQAFRGCMYPVRVRLVRADGALMEKVGCRAETGWSHNASETVDYFINTALGGAVEPKIATGAAAASEIEVSRDTTQVPDRAPAGAVKR